MALVNTNEHIDWKASRKAACSVCGKVEWMDDLVDDGENLFCWECHNKIYEENVHNLLHGKASMEDIEVVEVLDMIDEPYVASIVIEFTSNGVRYQATTDGIWDGSFYRYDGGDLEDVTKVD